MFSKIALFTAASMAVFVAAAPSPMQNSCNTGAIHCCNSVQAADSHDVTFLAGLLGLVLGPITGQVGLNCSPITAVGAAGNSCSQQPVCCEGNNFNGLIVVGCSPININL